MTPDHPKSKPDSSQSHTGDPKGIHTRFNFDLDDASWLARLRERIGVINKEASDSNDASEGATFTLGSESRSASGPLVGEQIGRYKIERLIGHGGMGSVYEAIQEHPRRSVALKLMKRGFASPSALKRFEYEAQILGRLRHPGIAQIYDAGTLDEKNGGVPYFAMEYIPDAKTITQYATEQKLGTRQRLELFNQVCDAVHHGHQKGVIHRDLKPSNILVESNGAVKIIDFGVARSTDSDMAATTMHTDVGQLVGTLQYMSPEQCAADPHDIDIRSDVYALGVLLYELLCDRVPYDLRRVPIHEATRMIREDSPARLSTIHRSLRGDVETIALRALEKERDRRYQSAAELGSDIQRFLRNEPIQARPPSVIYQVRVFARRNKALFGAIIAVFVVLVAGFIVSTTLYFRVRKEQVKAERVSGFMSDILEGAGPSVALGRDATMLKEMLDAAAKRIRDGELKDAPEAEVQLRGTIGMTYDELGQQDYAYEMIQPAIDQARRLYGGEHVEVATSLNNLASVLDHQGSDFESEQMNREALAMRRKLVGEVHPEVAQSLYNLSLVLWNQGRCSEAERLQREALEMRRKLFGEEHTTVAQSLANLALVLNELGNYSEAEQLHREALAMKRELLGEEHPTVANSLNNLALVLNHQGEYSEAEQLCREGLAMRRKLLGDEHGDVSNSLYTLARILDNQGNYSEAERLARESLALDIKQFGEGHPEVALCLNTLARILERQGKYEESEALARECLRICEAKSPTNPYILFEASGVLGAALTGRKQFAEAEPLLLSAQGGLTDHADVPPDRRRDPIEYLVKLYDAWNVDEPGHDYADKAAQWRVMLPNENPQP